MDNRIFNVNGQSDGMLLNTLQLVFAQTGLRTKAVGWSFDNKYGLVLYWSKTDSITMFPSSLTADQCVPFISAWLLSDDAKRVEKTDWDREITTDGSTSSGWRVYCENWGHVGGNHYSICAVKPVCLWHGK